MNRICAYAGCESAATKFCASCGSMSYCGTSCQKLHWKAQHRDRCLKRLPTILLPLDQVAIVLTDLSNQLLRLLNTGGSTDEQVVILKHAVTFAEFQLCVPSEPGRYYYSERKDGIKVDNLVVAHSMTSLYFNLGTRYSNQQSLKSAIEAEKYFTKSRLILEPLRLLMDSVIDDDALFDVSIHQEKLLDQLSRTERKLAINCMELKRFKESDIHCQQSLDFARRMKEGTPEGTTSVFEALSCLGELRGHQYWKDCEIDCRGAYDYFEEAYILVSEIYGPVHPQVQEVTANLVGSLIKLRDFEEAERFARINFESVTSSDSGIQPEDRQIMKAASMLVKVCYVTAQQRNVPLVSLQEGEDLARKVVFIAMKTDGSNSYDAGIYQFDLYQVLKERDRINCHLMTSSELHGSSEEKRSLLEGSLAIAVRCHGVDSKNAMFINQELYSVYKDLHRTLSTECGRSDALKRSVSHHNAAILVSLKVNGLNHVYTLGLIKSLNTLDIVGKLFHTYPKVSGVVAFCFFLLCAFCVQIRLKFLSK